LSGKKHGINSRHVFVFLKIHIKKKKKLSLSRFFFLIIVEMRIHSLLLFAAAIQTSLQTQVKGPSSPLQEPAPIEFVKDVLSNDNPQDYCNVSIQLCM
jgi:hypothetical protein